MKPNTLSLEDCRKMGLTHFHYGWSRYPWRQWTEEQKQAFREGYHGAEHDDARADAEGLYDKEHADDEPRKRRSSVRR